MTKQEFAKKLSQSREKINEIINGILNSKIELSLKEIRQLRSVDFTEMLVQWGEFYQRLQELEKKFNK